MAAGVLPKPGTKVGPCKATCAHRDCAETRFIAACVCRFCDKAIGYGVRFFMDPTAAPATADDRRWVHADCLEDDCNRATDGNVTALDLIEGL